MRAAAAAREPGLLGLLEELARGAAGRDAAPGFPGAALDRLATAGVLALGAPDEAGAITSFTEEWALLRAVAAADGSVARILDGHLNAVERLRVRGPEPLRGAELAAVAAGERRLGVWGADPLPGEGEPARLEPAEGGERIVGVKVFCSGAGGLDRALVSARDPARPCAPPTLVYVDLRARVEVDTTWYRGAGLRSSESHRVVFGGAAVLARVGGPGELTRDPEFSRDAIRTAACWAGLADAALGAALETLATRPDRSALEEHAAGAMLGAQATIDRWMEAAGARADADPDASLAVFSVHLRAAVAEACRAILDVAARACGSRPFAAAGRLDRARRDLEPLLLQHRLEPMLARVGRAALRERG